MKEKRPVKHPKAKARQTQDSVPKKNERSKAVKPKSSDGQKKWVKDKNSTSNDGQSTRKSAIKNTDKNNAKRIEKNADRSKVNNAETSADQGVQKRSKAYSERTNERKRYKDKGSRSDQGKRREQGAARISRPVTMVKAIKVTQTYADYVVTPPCPIFETCGGCQLQMFNDEGQLKYKYSQLIDLLGKFGKVEPIEGMREPFHYRHKTHATFSYSKGRPRRIIAGIFEEHSHRVVETENCLIQDERANNIIQSILALMPSFKMIPYDEDAEKGFLRHALIRTAFAHDGVMVVLVGGSPIFPAKRRFTEALIKKHPEIKTVIFNINSRKTSMVLGNREEVLYGSGYLEDSLCGMTFRISPKAFYQVNPEQTEKLYREAIKMAGLTGGERVLDAYAGIGTIGMVASTGAKEVISVELNKDAVRDAIRSARDNDVKNIYFHQADATEFIEQMAATGEKADIVFLDPPRSGSTPAFIKAVAKMKTDRVVYVSCNPETLARDLALFKSEGYKIVRIKPFDMFPWTGHVETVVRLQRQNP
ncbi:MAG: rRNA (uracil1939-C5)-methyltransferase [Clostridiales bacterium]|nr:rRNA (uracil1939-C5)-methyltransferase [Clostridiales bacterium]